MYEAIGQTMLLRSGLLILEKFLLLARNGRDVKVISNQKYAMDSDSLSPAESCGQIAKDILKRGNRAGCGLCNKLANSFCGGTSVLGLRAEGKEVETRGGKIPQNQES